MLEEASLLEPSLPLARASAVCVSGGSSTYYSSRSSSFQDTKVYEKHRYLLTSLVLLPMSLQYGKTLQTLR